MAKLDHERMARPIGVFDFGVGGLTVTREIIRVLPHEDLIFLNDNLNLLAGYKPEDVVRQDTITASQFLLQHNLKTLVIACNTATAVSLQHLRENCSIPVIGVIEPTARAAAETTRNGRIGVVGTNMTIRSNAYPRILKELNQDFEITSQACPLIVPMIEEGLLESEEIHQVAGCYLKQFQTKGIDTLILGCTHYSLIRSIIASLLPGVRLVDPAPLTAMELRRVLTTYCDLNSSHSAPRYVFYAADINEKVQRISKVAFGVEFPEIELCFQKADLQR